MEIIRRVRPEVSGEVLAVDYRKGATVRSLARVHGLAYGTIHRRLSEAGVAMRARGGVGRSVDAGQAPDQRLRNSERENASPRKR